MIDFGLSIFISVSALQILALSFACRESCCIGPMEKRINKRLDVIENGLLNLQACKKNEQNTKSSPPADIFIRDNCLFLPINDE